MIGSWRRAVVAGLCLLASALPAAAAPRGWVGMGVPLKNGTWTMLHGRVTNPDKTELNAQLVVAADAESNIQFSSPVWLPPESRGYFPLPFMTKAGETYELGTKLKVRLHEPGAMGPIIVEDISQILNQGDDSPTGVCVSRDDEDPGQAVTRLRATQRRKPKIAAIDPRQMPTSVMGLMGLTDFVFGAKDPLSAAQAGAIREWVARGGRLWLLADRVDAETARLILGNDWTCQEVGRTELTSVAFATGKQVDPATEYPEPVQMVRMVAPGMQILQKVEGWPAVMVRAIGKGQVIVSTIEPRAMGRPSGHEEFPYWFEQMATRFLGARAGMGGGGAEIVAKPQNETQVAMHDLSLSIVGHEVVQRAPVMLILGLLAASLVVIGWRLGRKRRLELMAPAAVVLSVLATGSMLVLGAMGRGKTPLTVAGMSEGLVQQASTGVILDGVADIYSPTAFEGSLLAPPGGWVTPDFEGQSGHVVRMRWSELERMRWDRVKFPSATLKSQSGARVRMDQAITARGTFGANGLNGQLRGVSGAEQMETVIVGPGGRMAPLFGSGGTFAAGEGQELRRDETTRGAITADARNRIEAMQPWVSKKSRGDFTLYTWTKSIDAGVAVERDGTLLKPERQLMTLLAVPLQIERPTGSEAFIIPPAFMKIAPVRVDKLGGMTPVYDERNLQFMGKIPTGAMSTIRFEVPAEILPLKVESYTLRIELSAPDREVKVFAIRRGQTGRTAILPLKTENKPNRPLVVEVKDVKDLQLDETGGVIFGLDVSGPEDPTDNTSTWSLTDMTLTVKAKTQNGTGSGTGTER